MIVDRGLVDSNNVGTKDVGFGSLGGEEGRCIAFRKDFINKDTMVEFIGFEDKAKVVGWGSRLIR